MWPDSLTGASWEIIWSPDISQMVKVVSIFLALVYSVLRGCLHEKTRTEFHTWMTFGFLIMITWWLGHFISCYLTVHFMLIKYTCDSKSQTLACATRSSILAHRLHTEMGGSFAFTWFLCEISHPGTKTRVNSRWGDWRHHDILWWYHVNKYRAMWGNRSELAPARKLPRCHVNTPLN